MPALHNKQLLAVVVFVGSTLVLATQIINPSPIMVSVGENGTNAAQLGSYFQYREVGVITIAATLLGASGMYLLIAEQPDEEMTTADPIVPTSEDSDGTAPSKELLESRRQEWEETAERLANKEQEVYQAVLDADGVLPQSEIVEGTDLSKASVSRALDSLEAKNIVERKRRGMGNMVLLL